MKKRHWLIPMLVVIVVSIMIGSFIGYRRFQPSEPPLTIRIDSHPKYVTSPTVILVGYVSQPAQITVTRDNSSLGTVFSSGNKFLFEVELEPGENSVRFSARTYEIDSMRAETGVTITWEPKNPPAPSLNSLPATTNLSTVKITGKTYPNGQLKITVSPDIPESSKNQSSRKLPKSVIPTSSEEPKIASARTEPVTKESTAGKDGTFDVLVTLIKPGPYTVTCVAYNSAGASSTASSDLKFVYDPDWYPPSSAAESPASKPILRKANIVIAHKQMIITLEVTLPRDDPAVTSLLANQTNLDDFFAEIFGLQINDTYYMGEFNDILPQIVINDQNATITATTAADRAVRDFLPLLHGELTLAGKNGFPFSNPEDSLSIRTNDYAIESISPPPTLLEKNTLTWIGRKANSVNGPRDVTYITPEELVTLQLTYRPFASPRNLLHLAQVSPYNFWRYPGNAIPTLLFGLSSLIPMLWLLWLIGESPIKNEVDKNLRNDLFRLSKTLITLSLIPTVFHISGGLGYLGHKLKILRHFYSSSHPVPLALANLAVLLLAILCRLLALTAPGRTWSIWLTRISNGFRNAAFFCLLLALVSFLNVNEYAARAASLTVIAITLVVSFSRIANVLRHGQLTPKYSRRLKLLSGFVSLAFLVPVVTPVGRQYTGFILSQAFSIMQDLLPYAIAIGLLIILKKASSSERRGTRVLVLCVGLILFSAYLVGSTPNLFMIPIPFILSIWIFKSFLIQDSIQRRDLDLINNEVVTDRRRLIEEVLVNETAQQIQANVHKLKDKVSSGDMTLKDFEDRKVEIERYAHDKELASTHTNGLRAKNTVLSVGPNTDDWMNGKWCAKWGAGLIAPFLIVYMLLLLFRARFSASAFAFLSSLAGVITFVADWLIAAFFFGYYFRYIRGNSGLEKGLRTACAVILCLLPTWFTNISNKTDLVGVFFRAGQTFLFFTLLGMGAFDYKTFRGALRDQFRWKTFARFGNMPSFTAVLSVLVTSVGVGLTSVLTGQFRELLTKLISAAINQTPNAPP